VLDSGTAPGIDDGGTPARPEAGPLDDAG
jgi:hypothetical protein